MSTIDLPSDIDQRIDRLSAATGRSRDALHHDLLRMGIEDLEDYCLAHQALAEHRVSGESTVGQAEARRRLGLDD